MIRRLGKPFIPISPVSAQQPLTGDFPYLENVTDVVFLKQKETSPPIAVTLPVSLLKLAVFHLNCLHDTLYQLPY